jgi:hypothetical protein
MCNVYAYAVMALISAYGAYEGAQGKGDEYGASADAYDAKAADYEEKAKLARQESSLSEAQAMDTLKIGKVEERKTLIEGKLFMGKQRASYGASGVRVDTGVATDVIDETGRKAEMDAITVRTNYAKEAYGYKLNAWRQRGESRTYLKSAEAARKAAEKSRDAEDRTRKSGFLGALASGFSSYAGRK